MRPKPKPRPNVLDKDKSGNLRFWLKVEIPIHPDGCWLWTARLDDNGYGEVSIHGRRRRAHHVGWFIKTGEWPPEGLELCHGCDNPQCVRPDHMFIGTHADNMRDMLRKGRNPAIGARGPSTHSTPIGSQHGGSVLNESQVLEIRRRHEAGERQYKLCEEFGISGPNMNAIIHRRIWKHI